MTYKIIEESILKAYNLSEEHVLTIEDITRLVVNKELIAKYIRLKWISIQFDIGAWSWKDKTDIWLEVVAQLWSIADDVLKIEDVYNEYTIKQEELKKKEK